jgi:hypothetical protein
LAQDLLPPVLDFKAARSGIRDADLEEEGSERGGIRRLAEFEVAQGGEEAAGLCLRPGPTPLQACTEAPPPPGSPAQCRYTWATGRPGPARHVA